MFEDRPELCPATVPVALSKYEETLALGLYAQLSQNGVTTAVETPGPHTDVIEHTLQEHRAGRLAITVRRTYHNGDRVYVEQAPAQLIATEGTRHKKRKC